MAGGELDDTLSGIRERYARAFRQHGDTPQGVLYHSASSQLDRYAIISRIFDFRGSSVLDVGCGTGDLYPCLRERHGEFSYTGLEVVAETTAAAAGKFPDAEFINGTLADLPADRRFDVVLESGIFNTSEYTFAAMESVVRGMWERCRKVCIVNLLSCMSTGNPNADSSYYHPADAVALAMRLTRRFSFLHSYRDNDMTLVLFRDDAHPGTDQRPLTVVGDLVRRPV